MTTRMLIDARHPEETRVAVLKGNRIEEFDFESAEHKQIKGNIYLAKVTRVEPSLQAAFVDFGGNRHGFLAFSEIHPDYYQIPKEDRDALLAEEAAHAEEEAELRAADEAEGGEPDDGLDDEDDESSAALADDLANDGMEEIDTSEKDDVATIEDGEVEHGGEDNAGTDDDGEDQPSTHDRGRGRGRGRRQGRGRAKQADELRDKRMALRRRYKIQDVIQRRQVLLVQVVKEERGNKGAALTTYLSLAGRYCVLMPNSNHGGGISRKISSAADRKRLKTIIAEMNLPRSMGCIVRTAGLSRTKTEIKRDFDYLARLWDEIRERTLGSSAPAVIHSDSDLIKRAIRDIYNREIEEVVVEGEAGYRAAKEFMKLLMPSHARRVKAYSDPVPLFQRYGAEDQLSAMYDPEVQLKSGGYLVINPTEALVSIDINSGRSTKEHGIEATATATNLEAAREIARQLRLRDMAGLVVIDFIDMENNGNIRKVEKTMKDALKNDRARIQVGRISGFGLMEMSRQRLRTGVLEATTRSCPHCDGTGLVRTASSAGLSALRLIEDEAAKGKGSMITLHASTEAAVYLLNAKRSDLAEIEARYGVQVEVVPEGEDEGAKMRVASSGPRPAAAPKFDPIVDDDDGPDEDYADDEDVADEDDRDQAPRRSSAKDDDESGNGRNKRRRRRGGRGRSRDDDRTENGSEGLSDSGRASEERADHSLADNDDDNGEDRPRKRRRRGGRRRGGRGRGEGGDTTTGEAVAAEAMAEVSDQLTDDIAVVAGPEDAPESAEAMAAGEKPKRTRSRRKKIDEAAEGDAGLARDSAPEAEAGSNDEAVVKPKRTRRKKVDADADRLDAPAPPASEAEGKPKRTRRKKADVEAEATADPGYVNVEPETEPATAIGPGRSKTATKGSEASHEPSETTAGDDNGEPRRGWWQRTFG